MATELGLLVNGWRGKGDEYARHGRTGVIHAVVDRPDVDTVTLACGLTVRRHDNAKQYARLVSDKNLTTCKREAT